MRWRPCSPDPMRRIRAAPHIRVCLAQQPVEPRFPSPSFRDPVMQARPLLRRASKPAAHGSEAGRRRKRAARPARGMGLPHKFPRQTTGNRPSNEAQTASFKGPIRLVVSFFVRVATAFSFAGAPRGRHAAPRAAALPKKGKRSEPGQAVPAARPLSISRFFLSPSAPPESKPRGAHAGHGGQQAPRRPAPQGLVTPVTGGPFVLSTVLITVKPDVSSPSMLRRISAPPATKRSPSP